MFLVPSLQGACRHGGVEWSEVGWWASTLLISHALHPASFSLELSVWCQASRALGQVYVLKEVPSISLQARPGQSLADCQPPYLVKDRAIHYWANIVMSVSSALGQQLNISEAERRWGGGGAHERAGWNIDDFNWGFTFNMLGGTTSSYIEWCISLARAEKLAIMRKLHVLHVKRM